MSREVIINADDFGMSEAFNHGVIKGYLDGVVSSTTIMINMPSVNHGVTLLKEKCPDLFVGLHVNFVLGKPCADPNEIPSLVDEEGNFYSSKEYRTGRKTLEYEDVKKETLAQIERFKEVFGYYPKHIEGHAVSSDVTYEVFMEVSRELGIHCSVFDILKLQNPLKGCKKIKRPDCDYSVITNRGVLVEDFLNDEYGILKDNDSVIELHFHPGYLDKFILDNSSLTLPRCIDLGTLCDERLKVWLKENDVNAISFGDLIS